MLLRPGNAGSNTFTDHKEVLAAAIRQVPARFRAKILVRVDGAGASHELIKHLLSLSSARRTMLFTCGWMITAADVISSPLWGVSDVALRAFELRRGRVILSGVYDAPEAMSPT